MSSQAKRGYEGYAASTGGKTFDGRDMPLWDDLPARIQEAWRAAIAAAIDSTPKSETLTDKQVRLLHESETASIGRKPFATPPSHPPMNGRLWVGQIRPSLDVLSEALRPDQGFVLLTADFGPSGNLALVIANTDIHGRLCRVMRRRAPMP